MDPKRRFTLAGNWLERTPFSPRVSDAETARIAEGLAHLLRAAVPHSRAFDVLLSARRSRAARRGLEAVRDSVLSGHTFHDGFRARASLWPRYLVELVRCAEIAGRLPEALDEAAAHFGGMLRLRRTAHLMWLGPLVILIIGTFIRGMLHLYFLGDKAAVAFFQAQALWALPPIIVVLLFVYVTPLRRILDRVVLAIPIASETVRDLAVYQFTRCFQLLYAGSASAQTAVRLAGNAVGNTHYRRRLTAAADDVAAGIPFSQAIGPKVLWPSGYMESFRSAETSGQIDVELDRLARLARQALETRADATRQITYRIAFFAVSMSVAVELYFLILRTN